VTASLPVADDQRATIDFLSRPASYGLRDGAVERIDTHCSIVFLAGDRAYKFKRAIRYAALDYATRERRLAACEAEIRLNRRTAPELYLGVRSINRGDGGALAFDGPGPAVDHVVVMRRFAESDLFDHMADDGRLTPELMRGLGEAVARLHLAAEVMPSFGGSGSVRRAIDENDHELARVATVLDGAAAGIEGRRARAALDAVAPLLDRRRAEGRVRRCHGDLRLANVCLFAGRPTPFDHIDFSDEVGCIDVLYDLAFLLMDLELRGRGDLGNATFNAYLDLCPETDGLATLPLFLALRAAMRSYALAGGAARHRDEPARAAHLLLQARRHLAASIDFLAPAPPLLIVVGGPQERGRAGLASALCGLVAPAPGARLLRLAPSSAAAWRDGDRVLAAGCSVLVEGWFAEPADSATAAALAARHSAGLLAMWRGPPPPDSGGLHWRPLDDGPDFTVALAQARSLLADIEAQQPTAGGPA
jgi:uncharacterized protein